MTKLLVLALCVCLGMSMSVKERLENREALNESAKPKVLCEFKMLANDICDAPCNIEGWNYDEGDCCQLEWIGDGTCNPECAMLLHSDDGGDCDHLF